MLTSIYKNKYLAEIKHFWLQLWQLPALSIHYQLKKCLEDKQQVIWVAHAKKIKHGMNHKDTANLTLGTLGDALQKKSLVKHFHKFSA